MRADLRTMLQTGARPRIGVDAMSPCPTSRQSMPLLDRLEPLAQQVGAVNTVVKAADGKLVGRNTDVAGFLEPLDRSTSPAALFPHGASNRNRRRCTGDRFGSRKRGLHPRASRDGTGPRPTPCWRNWTQAGNTMQHRSTHFAAATDFVFDDRKGCCDLVVNASPAGNERQAAAALRLESCSAGFDCLRYRHGPRGYTIF